MTKDEETHKAARFAGISDYRNLCPRDRRTLSSNIVFIALSFIPGQITVACEASG